MALLLGLLLDSEQYLGGVLWEEYVGEVLWEEYCRRSYAYCVRSIAGDFAALYEFYEPL